MVNDPEGALGVAALLAALLVLLSGQVFIPKLHKLKYGQSIREEGPKSHQAKSGTPTMGGLMIIPAIAVGALAAAGHSPEVLLAVFVMVSHCAIGFADDYIKVVKKRNLGLTAKQKLAAQILVAVVVIIVGQRWLGLDNDIWLPLEDRLVDIGGWYYPFVLCVLVGTTNAVNLTDGLDGLAAGTVAVAALAQALIAWKLDHPELAAFGVATAAAAIAFLRFNAHPARIFMGDTGSLALGGALAAMAIVTQTELLLPLVGAVFVAEALSVIIQVISFKSTGKRVFRMSPIHHHFELGGWSENRVVFTFWTVGALAGLVALAIFYWPLIMRPLE